MNCVMSISANRVPLKVLTRKQYVNERRQFSLVAFQRRISTAPESVSDEENDVTSAARGDHVSFERRESTCTVFPRCAALAPQFYNQRGLIVLRTVRETIELSARESEALLDITDRLRRSLKERGVRDQSCARSTRAGRRQPLFSRRIGTRAYSPTSSKRNYTKAT